MEELALALGCEEAYSHLFRFAYRNFFQVFRCLRCFFFLIGKDNSLRAKRLEKGYTRSIPRYKEAKKQKDKQVDPYLVAS